MLFRVVTALPSTLAPPRIGFDLGHALVYLGRRVALRGAEEKRPYELALLLAHAGALDLTRARLVLHGAPVPRKVREWARLLVERAVAVWSAPNVLTLPPGASVSHAPTELARALERLQLELQVDGRVHAKKSDADLVRARLAAIEGMLLRQDHAGVLRAVQGRAEDESFLTALARGITPSARPRLLVVAHTLAGMAAMNSADLRAADAHLGKAAAIARTLDRASYWRARVAVTRSAVARMRAAFEPDRAVEHLRGGIGYWQEMELLLDDAAELPEDVVGALVAWRAEMATPVTLLADLGAREPLAITNVRETIDRARVLGESPFADPSVGPTADLMELRVALSEARDGAALGALDTFERKVAEPGTPAWLQGWVPRYTADLAFSEGATPMSLWPSIEAAWKTNATLRFQRLLVLARVAAWRLPTGFRPPDPRAETIDAMQSLADELHVERHGHPADRCLRCRSTGDPRLALGRRIGCALALSGGGPLQLGVWR